MQNRGVLLVLSYGTKKSKEFSTVFPFQKSDPNFAFFEIAANHQVGGELQVS
jgi:hypothetical protein